MTLLGNVTPRLFMLPKPRWDTCTSSLSRPFLCIKFIYMLLIVALVNVVSERSDTMFVHSKRCCFN